MKHPSFSFLVNIVLAVLIVMMLSEIHAVKEELLTLKQQQRKYVDTKCLRQVLLDENKRKL